VVGIGLQCNETKERGGNVSRGEAVAEYDATCIGCESNEVNYDGMVEVYGEVFEQDGHADAKQDV
jgi:hypothetical protein